MVHSLLIQRLGIVHIEDAQSERKSASSWWNIGLYVLLLSTCVNLVLPVPTVIHAHIVSILSPSLMTRCGHLYAIQPLPNLDANMTFNIWTSNWVIFLFNLFI